MNTKLNSFIKHLKFHLEIVLRGLGRTLHGSLITGLIAFAIYGFFLINKESGYSAVFDFIAAIAILVIALCNVYLLGSKRKGGKK